jgi:hypothetical protein
MNTESDTDSTADHTPEQSPLDCEDFYFDGGQLVFTAAFHLKRGACCGSGCRHCPYPAAPAGAA